MHTVYTCEAGYKGTRVCCNWVIWEKRQKNTNEVLFGRCLYSFFHRFTQYIPIFQSKSKHYMYTKQNTISCDLIKIVHSDPIHYFLYISIIKAVQKLIMFTILVLKLIYVKCRWVHLVYFIYSPIVYKFYTNRRCVENNEKKTRSADQNNWLNQM